MLTARALDEGGALANAITGYAPRPAQQRLGVAIAETMAERGALVAEAGTGTGKTYAYLVPALLSGQRVIVSTGTKALQDQLYHRDLPKVREALGLGLRTALLKGRSNYLCLQRTELAKGAPVFSGREQIAQFERIVQWSKRTRRGDLAEIEDLPEDSPLRGLVTSTVENCLGSECPFWQDCFVVKARAEAQAADLVVINHHLLLADLAIKEEGFGEILPGASAFVLDEAHQLPDLASQFFGESVSARMLIDLTRDAIGACGKVAGSLAAVSPAVRELEAAIRLLRAQCEGLPQRGTLALLLDHHADMPALVRTLDAAMAGLAAAVAPMKEAAPEFAAVLTRLELFQTRLRTWAEGAPGLLETDDGDEASNEHAGPTDGAEDEDRADTASHGEVRWFELTQRGFAFSITPLDVAGPLRRYREQSKAAWIFTSATLAVGGDLKHIAWKLGLHEPRTLLEQSPFDWKTQSLAYFPPGLPEPSSRDYTERVVAAVRPVLEASKGRAFLLFTSHRALREAAALLAGGPWPLFVQGTAPRLQLIEQFRASGNGVLLGAASFWEGVDVAGDALSVVVIDKLPFAAPDDPVLEARLEAVRRRGGNPFLAEQVPTAAIALKQGVGRLIRRHDDRGVLVLCDPRLVSKPYGRVFMASLPPLTRTKALADVQAFFDPSLVPEPAP
ncbi:ATP-dependent DNA helicase [Silanimonas sp.]|uniref:ATP-dependent DNA helicase n=1 Tax=Silanimonas sp. TaxID=1929290 RepID=UPI0037CAA721